MMNSKTAFSVLLVTMLGMGTAACVSFPPIERSFYQASNAELAGGAPGSIIRSEPYDIGIEGAEAWRVLYRSVGLNGEPVAVSGVIIAPIEAPPPGGRPVVAWAHQTTGVARHCALTLEHDVASEIPGLPEMISRGYVVAATDYVGLGTVGPHPYLIGESAARSVLDSVRAAEALAGGSSEFVVWGHSEGGHAALWTGLLAADYAPDLTLLGVAAAAPATELANLFNDDITELSGKAFSSLTLLSWSQIYGLDLAVVVEQESLPDIRRIGQECVDLTLDDLVDAVAAVHMGDGFLIRNPTNTPPWDKLIADNTPGTLPRRMPVFVAQGSKDTVVHPNVTEAYAMSLCRAGSPVAFVELDTDHTGIAKAAADQAVDWFADRFARAVPTNNCSSL